MNKVFKSVWNASLGAWVAVSEFEGLRGKFARSAVNGQGERSNRCGLSAERFVLTLLTASVLFALRSGAAMAAAPSLPVYDPAADLPCFFDRSSHSVICGDGAATPDKASQNAIAIGLNAVASNAGDIVIGAGAATQDGSAYFRNNTVVGAGSTAIGIGHTVLGADNRVHVKANDPDAMWGTVVAGRLNTVNAGNSSVIGDKNLVDQNRAEGAAGSYGSHVQGNENVVSNNSYHASILGLNNTVNNSPNSTVLGQRNSLTGSEGNAVLGRHNVIENSTFNTINGSNNTLNNVVGLTTAQGGVRASNSVTGAQNKLDAVKGSTNIVGDRNTLTARKDDGTTVRLASFSGVEVLGSDNTLKAENAGTRARISVLGSGNTLNGKATDAVVIGSKNTVAGNFAGTQVLGSEVTVSGEARDSVVIGKRAQLSATNAVALGSGATVSIANSIALGAGAVADAVPVAVNEASIREITYGGFAGVAQADSGVVSVGSGGKERQITHVAAGRITADSTDAINGSQLFATNTVLGNVAGSTATILGGNAKVDPATGNLSMSNVGGTGKDNIHDAIADVRAKRPEVVQGDGIKVTPVTADDKTTYTVALNDATKADIQTGKDAAQYTFTSGDETLLTIQKDEARKNYLFTPVTGSVAENSTGLVTGGDVHKAINDATASAKLEGFSFTGNSGSTGEKKLGSSIAVTGKEGSGLSSTASDTGIVFDLNAKTVADNINGLGDNNPFANKDLGNVSDAGKGNLVNLLGDKFVKLDASNIGNNKADWVNALGDNVAAGATGLAKAADVYTSIENAKTDVLAKRPEVAQGDGIKVTPVTVEDKTTYTVALNDKVKAQIEGASKGWNLTVNGKDSTNVAPGATVNFTAADDNIVLSKAGNDLTVGLAKNLAVDSVKTGDSVLTSDGLKITGGPSVTKAGIHAGGKKITNVAAGTELTDAVNLEQLRQIESLASAGWSIGNADGLVGKVAPGARVDFVAGNTSTRVNVTQDNGGARVQVSAAPAALQYTDSNKAAGGNTPNADQFKPTNQVTLVGADSTAPVSVNNVANAQLAADSLQAVNGSQLFGVGDSIAKSLGGNTVFNPATGRVETSLNINGNTYTSLSDALSNIGQGGGTGGWNLQVNGETPTKIGSDSTVGFNAGNNIALQRTGNTVTISTAKDVAFDSVKANVVSAANVRVSESVGVIDGPSMSRDGIDAAGKPISNVAPGVKPGDVATVGQVGRALNQIDGKVEQYRKDARGGTAAAMAMAGLPQAYLPGKSMFAIGGSTFQGQSGYAVGLSTVSENGSWVLKGSVSGSGRGQLGGTVGIGYQW